MISKYLIMSLFLKENLLYKSVRSTIYPPEHFMIKSRKWVLQLVGNNKENP